MQRPRNPIGFFPEPIDIDQGTVSNNSGLSLQPPINNMINPIESRLSNDNMASGESSSVNVIHDVPSSSGWSSWESGSRFCLQNQPEPTNDLFPERVSLSVSGNQDRSGPLFMQGVGSNMPTLRLSPHNYNSSHLGVDHSSPFNASSGDIDTSSQESGYVLHETSSGSGSSNGGWGLSCKRKAHEGTSGHSFPGGSSSCSPMAESGPWHPGPSRRNASSNSLSLTTPQIFPPITPPEPTNQRFSFGLRGAYSDAFPSSGMARDAATLRSLSGRVNTGHQEESASFNLSTGGSRNSNIWLSNQPTRQSLFRGSIDLGPSAEASVNCSSAQGPPNATYPSFSSRNLHPFPWDGSSSSRAGSSSRSLLPGERGAPAREEANLRSIPRNNSEYPMLIPVTEMSNMRQDPGGWSLTAGNTSTSFPRNGASSSNHPLPTSPWVPHLNPTTSVSQRFTEVAPWSLFPSVDVEAGSRHMPFHSSSPGPPSSVQDTAMSSASSSQGPLQPFPRSSFSMEGQGNDMLGMPRSLRALAADIQGRHRLISEQIRQVLNAMRRRENIRVEDFMHFDQFLYRGIADMHDRHRDMRLDVDNMSYEELLALEERIGDVSTGLSEETILKWMKQQMFASVTRESPAELEPCCICQEDYIDGDDLGLLDCGHDFHTDCIKKWLMQKNICPICKMTGLQSCEGTGSR